jgi:hypothetical protein
LSHVALHLQEELQVICYVFDGVYVRWTGKEKDAVGKEKDGVQGHCGAEMAIPTDIQVREQARRASAENETAAVAVAKTTQLLANCEQFVRKKMQLVHFRIDAKQGVKQGAAQAITDTAQVLPGDATQGAA